MKILIDLGHPAHIHYFKNFIWIMEQKGHRFCLVARDKEVLHQLLDYYKFEYTNRGAGGKSLISKIFYILKADYVIFRAAKKFKPDIFVSFASTYAAHVSKLMKKPHIVLDDTEHAKFELMMYPPFSDVILNPKSFWKKFSSKQIFFDSFMELSHLHPKYFTPDPKILEGYGLNADERFFIVRFISWTASHDIGQSGLSLDLKKQIVTMLEKSGKVLISSESELPIELERYKIQINPAHLHHFLYHAGLYIGEGATTAAEAIMLGTPAIYINSLDAGTISEQATKFGLISLRNAAMLPEILEKVLLQDDNSTAALNRSKVLSEKIDVTSFMVWFVENYPASETTMRINPDYQYNFK